MLEQVCRAKPTPAFFRAVARLHYLHHRENAPDAERRAALFTQTIIRALGGPCTKGFRERFDALNRPILARRGTSSCRATCRHGSCRGALLLCTKGCIIKQLEIIGVGKFAPRHDNFHSAAAPPIPERQMPQTTKPNRARAGWRADLCNAILGKVDPAACENFATTASSRRSELGLMRHASQFALWETPPARLMCVTVQSTRSRATYGC